MIKLFIILFFSLNAYSYDLNPSNKLSIESNDIDLFNHTKSMKRVTRADYLYLTKKFQNLYGPILKTKTGLNLKFEDLWDDPRIMLRRSIRENNLNVKIGGGFAKNYFLNKDVIALLTCEIITFDIAGPPFRTWIGETLSESSWPQISYYATLKCLRKYFRDEDNNKALSGMNIPSIVVDKCQSQFSDTADQLICKRSSMAALLYVNFKQTQGVTQEPLGFENPDPRISRITHERINNQCLLDTYFAGALCRVHESEEVSKYSESAGVCHAANGDEVGLRSACWFFPSN